MSHHRNVPGVPHKLKGIQGESQEWWVEPGVGWRYDLDLKCPQKLMCERLGVALAGEWVLRALTSSVD
jgi:hypothetical protein